MPTAVLPERRCDNCGKRYRPKQRLKKNDKHGFCNRKCKDEFYQKGGSYAKLKPYIDVEIRKRIKELSPADGPRIENIERRLANIEEMLRRTRDALS